MPQSPGLSPDPPRRHTTRFWVHYRMTDKMGVVYYGNYLELFEMGRSTMIREGGFLYSQMEADGFFLPVVHAEVDYLGPAYYDDLLLIDVWITRLDSRRIDFAYEIRRNELPQPICRGTTRHLIAGPEGRPRRLTADWTERLERLR